MLASSFTQCNPIIVRKLKPNIEFNSCPLNGLDLHTFCK